MIEPVWIVAFTGHRPGTGPGRSRAELAGVREPLKEIFRDLQERAACRGGRIELFTGVAAGADLEAAEVASELGLAVHVILPLDEKEFEKDFKKDINLDWARAKKLIDAAKAFNEGGSFRVAQTSANRPDCYYDAGIEMLQSADVLIAVWNGEREEGLGGSAQVVEYAEANRIPVIQTDPSKDGAITSDKMASDWPKPDGVLQEITEILNSEGEPSRKADDKVAPIPDDIFELLDEVATQRGKQFRGGLTWSVWFHYFAAILAATSVAISPVFLELADRQRANWATMNTPRILTGLEFALVFAALCLTGWSYRRHLHGRWRQLRFAAELVRGLRAASGLLDVFPLLAVRYSPSWRRFAVSMGLAIQRATDRELSFDARKQSYLAHRIEHQRDEYFKHQHIPAIRWAHWLARTGWCATVLAPLFILTALILKLEKNSEPWIVTTWTGALLTGWFPVLLPLIAGAATSLSIVKDSGRRAERYHAVFEQLDALSKSFPLLRTKSSVVSAVMATEEVLLSELVEWYVAAKNVAH